MASRFTPASGPSLGSLPRGHACSGAGWRRAPPFPTQRAGHPARPRGAAARGSKRRRAGSGTRSPPRSPPYPREESRRAWDAWVESGPRGHRNPPPLRPKLREPSPRGGLGGATRGSREGLSSGNALRETEGKTSRGRSAVIGLETDLKGKVGAVAWRRRWHSALTPVWAFPFPALAQACAPAPPGWGRKLQGRGARRHHTPAHRHKA